MQPDDTLAYLTDVGSKQPRGDQRRAATSVCFAQVCVQTSMREANDRGYECLLVSDATESYFPEFKASTLKMVTAQGGIVGWVADSLAVEAAFS